ncbi:hypothetical protein K432DRAFT_147356 [Lepidopterella palustris CBS 459.81]|uniref:J domain-containing protein n=1 Tax=Lepidopterella palustris CBS 459.81 TaxID=1314670 RepID=A0A8E2EHK8_9PEZI|nr:hypothetical protein K432DRAFT_147356 [Lepidopterella palustris CBS 459.81]
MVTIDAKRDYYADLGVNKNADTDTIRRSYRELAKKYHPDKHRDDYATWNAKFQIINAAHEILSDRDQRRKYDIQHTQLLNKQDDAAAARARADAEAKAKMRDEAQRRAATERNIRRAAEAEAARYRAKPNSRPSPFPQHGQPYQQQSYGPPNGADRFSNFAKTTQAGRAPWTTHDDGQARASVFTAWEHIKHNAKAGLNTQSTASGGGNTSGNGENTTNPNLGRSNTSRAKKPGFDPATPGADEKQAAGSFYYTTPRQTRDYRPADFSEDIDSPQNPRMANGYFHNFGTEDDAASKVPFAEGAARERNPYSSTTHERTAFSTESLRRSASTRGSSDNAGFFSEAGQPNSSRPRSAHIYTKKAGSQPKTPTTSGNAKKPFGKVYLSHHDDEDPEVTETYATTREASANMNRSQTSANTGTTQPTSTTQPNIFTVPTTDDGLKFNPNGFKSRSEESINTKFSANDWSGKFQGTPEYFVPPSSTGGAAKGRQSPTRGRASSRRPASQQGTARPPPPPPPPPFFPPPSAPPVNTRPGAASGPQPVKFSPEQWQETFKEATWAYPTKVSTSTSAKRTKHTISRKSSTIPKAATVTDELDDEVFSNSKNTASAESSNSEESSGMDIDTDVPAAPSHASKDKQPSASSTHVSEPKSEGLESLSGLKNVAPLATPADGGLGDLNDLSSTLPFMSGASSSHPKKVSVTVNVDLPAFPKAPEAPAHLTKSTYSSYMTHMSSYMWSWTKFNNAMVAHFVAREEWTKNLSVGWLNATGETSEQPGFPSYMRSLEQDRRVRAHWTVASEKHHAAMQVCEQLRKKAALGLPVV